MICMLCYAFLVMNPCSHDFLLMALYIYSNKMMMEVGLTYSAWFLDSELSTCYIIIITIFIDYIQVLIQHIQVTHELAS